MPENALLPNLLRFKMIVNHDVKYFVAGASYDSPLAAKSHVADLKKHNDGATVRVQVVCVDTFEPDAAELGEEARSQIQESMEREILRYFPDAKITHAVEGIPPQRQVTKKAPAAYTARFTSSFDA